MKRFVELERRFKDLFFAKCKKKFGKDFGYFEPDLGFDGEHIDYTLQDPLRDMVMHACNNMDIQDVVKMILGIKNKFPEIHFLEKDIIEKNDGIIKEVAGAIKALVDNSPIKKRRYATCAFSKGEQEIARVRVTLDAISYAEVNIYALCQDEIVDFVYFDAKSNILFCFHKKEA